MNGCEFCRGESTIELDSMDIEVYKEDTLEITVFAGLAANNITEYIFISYCPFCGRKVETQR